MRDVWRFCRFLAVLKALLLRIQRPRHGVHPYPFHVQPSTTKLPTLISPAYPTCWLPPVSRQTYVARMKEHGEPKTCGIGPEGCVPENHSVSGAKKCTIFAHASPLPLPEGHWPLPRVPQKNKEHTAALRKKSG